MNRCGLTPYTEQCGVLLDRPPRTSKTSLIFLAPPKVPLGFGWLGVGIRSAPDGDVRRLRRVPIKGDGRCLYRAISRGIAVADGRDLSLRWETEDADALRLLAYSIICKKKRGEYKKMNLIEGGVETYCAKMLDPRFFAGEIEMKELADALKRPIAVYIPQAGSYRNIVTYGEKWGRSRKRNPVRLLYNGYNHYDLLCL